MMKKAWVMGLSAVLGLTLAPLAIAQTPSAPDLADGASLAQSMQTVADAVTAQGTVSFNKTVTILRTNKVAMTFTRTVTITNFRPDPANCYLYYHLSDHGGVSSTDMDTAIPFSQIHETTVISLDKQLDFGPGNRTTVQPQIYVVDAVEGFPKEEFYFYDQTTAMRVADAIRHATDLCGGGKGPS